MRPRSSASTEISGRRTNVATKAAVIGMTKVWARELGPKGITVNAVAPGFIGTEMVRQMPEKILATMVERTPIRRLGETKDVAYAYLFLASDEASFINGAVLSVDGGVVGGTWRDFTESSPYRQPAAP